MDFSKFRKLERLPNPTEHPDESSELKAIVKVTMADYVPPYMTLRSRIDPLMFTADIKAADLARAESDDQVEAVSLSRPV